MNIIHPPAVAGFMFDLTRIALGGTQMGAFVISGLNDKEHLGEMAGTIRFTIKLARFANHTIFGFAAGKALVGIPAMDFTKIVGIAPFWTAELHALYLTRVRAAALSARQAASLILAGAMYDAFETLIDCSELYANVIYELSRL